MRMLPSAPAIRYLPIVASEPQPSWINLSLQPSVRCCGSHASKATMPDRYQQALALLRQRQESLVQDAPAVSADTAPGSAARALLRARRPRTILVAAAADPAPRPTLTNPASRSARSRSR